MESRSSISQQLNDLFNPKPPEEYDPENEFTDDRMRDKYSSTINAETAPDFGQRRILPDIPLDPKFAAKKVSRAELDQIKESDSEEVEEDAEESAEANGSSEEDIDAALNAIQQEDQVQAKKAEKTAKLSELERAQQVVLQRKVTDGLVGLRILIEKLLTVGNKLPQSHTVGLFKENVADVAGKYDNCISGIKQFLKASLSVQAQLAKQAGLADSLEKGKDDDQTDKLWERIEKNKSLIKDKVYDVVENWMEKTQIYVNTKLKQNTKALGTHPLRQAEDKYSKNKAKMLQKVQTKSKAFKVLGNPASTIHEMRDKEIYDDSEFYQTFLRDYLSLNAKSVAGSKEEEELNWTYKYLQSKGIAKKEKVGAPLIESKKRKNKTLKYVVHEKLVNFMAQQENPHLLPGYKNMVKSLFGIKKEDEPEKRKRIGTEELMEEMEKIDTKEEEGMDVALI